MSKKNIGKDGEENMGLVTLTYSDQPEKMVKELIAKTGALDPIRPDDTVMIKPNLVASRKDWIGVNTDPRVVEALVKVLKARGIYRITIYCCWPVCSQRKQGGCLYQ